MTLQRSTAYAQALLGHLNPDEQQEFMDLTAYIGEKAGRGGSGRMPEDSIGNLLNKASPRVARAFKTLSDVVETPRHHPFHEKHSEAEIFDAMGFDAEAGVMAKAAIDAQHVMGELQSKMGTDADLPDQPLTMRDNISAAVDAHSGE
jgi:hypothetical protein